MKIQDQALKMYHRIPTRIYWDRLKTTPVTFEEKRILAIAQATIAVLQLDKKFELYEE